MGLLQGLMLPYYLGLFSDIWRASSSMLIFILIAFIKMRLMMIILHKNWAERYLTETRPTFITKSVNVRWLEVPCFWCYKQQNVLNLFYLLKELDISGHFSKMEWLSVGWQHHLSYFDSILTLFSEELDWYLFCAIFSSHLKRLLCTTILANELLNYRVIINCHTQRQQCNVTWLRSDKIHTRH